LKDRSDDISLNYRTLKKYIVKEVIPNSIKLKGKFAPISEIVANIPKILSIKSIHKLNDVYKDFYLIIVKNYLKQPKERYFLAIVLATQSSDLLVILAKDYAKTNELKLIQYNIIPKSIRTSLLSLKELTSVRGYPILTDLLVRFRQNFRDTLEQFIERK
jgi:hypothetical protein